MSKRTFVYTLINILVYLLTTFDLISLLYVYCTHREGEIERNYNIIYIGYRYTKNVHL